MYPVDALEPNQFKSAAFVGNFTDQPLCSPVADNFKAGEPAGYLHPFGGCAYLADGSDDCLVDVPKRKVFQQVAESEEAEFFLQQFCPLWAHTFYVFDRAR
jgi:hypothetical protein